jgi:hypothetical protein
MVDRRLYLFVISYSLCFTGTASAQAFLFVSPNTRDHMSDESAADALNSFEQKNFLAVANHLGVKACTKPRVVSAEGIYAKTAENSILVTGCGNGQAQYLGELLGRYAHQKWILVFNPSPKSNEHLFILTFSSDHSEDAAQALRSYRISGATMVIQNQTVRVYIWVTDISQDAAVHAFADGNHATLEDIAGKGTLIGDDSRALAQRIFDQRIQAYERVHHRSLSRLLWSKQLHDLGKATPGAHHAR